mmetsp:Transcript_5648/g.9759  ORF Transcript_5648/g.9759 Transcript_5648/m.9759 type:complete len:390 (+) Transcript_5648:311-1480(+)
MHPEQPSSNSTQIMSLGYIYHRLGRTCTLLGLGVVFVVFFEVVYKTSRKISISLAETVAVARTTQYPLCTLDAHARNSLFVKASSCPQQPWLKHYWDSHLGSNKSAGSPFVVFDVGANKGYFTGEILRTFFPGSYDYLPSRILRTSLRMGCGGRANIGRGDTQAGYNLSSCCGACRECTTTDPIQDIARTNEIAGTLIVHLFEPSQNNFKILSMVYQKLQQLGVAVLHNAAVSNFTGKGYFPDTKPGYEKGSLDVTSTKRAIRINVFTLDHLLQTSGLSYANVVKIDAEGYDPAVLQGAQRCIAQGTCPVICFEIDMKLGWYISNSPESLLLMFERLQYECFLEGKLRLLRLSKCHMHAIELHKMSWLNVVCAHRLSQGWLSLQQYVHF